MASDDIDRLIAETPAADPTDALIAETQATPAPKQGKPKPPTLLKAALKGVQDLPTFGFGNELGALEQAALQKVFTKDPSSFGDIYRQVRGENRQESEAARQEHAPAYYGAGLVPTLMTSAVTSPIRGAMLAKALGLGGGKAGLLAAESLASTGNAGLQGFLSGVGESTAEDLGGRLAAGVSGAQVAGPLGAVMPGAGRLVSALGPKKVAAALGGAYGYLTGEGDTGDKIGRALLFAGAAPAAVGLGQGVAKVGGALADVASTKATDLYDRLKALGVDVSKLSWKQLHPESSLASLEELASKNELVGPFIKAKQEGGLKAWREATRAKAFRAGVKPPSDATPDELIAAMYGSYSPEYEKLSSLPVAGAGPEQQSLADQLRKEFADITANPGIAANPDTRDTWLRTLQSEAGVAGHQSGAQPSVGQLQDVRQAIRDHLRDIKGPDQKDVAARKFLGAAQDAVTARMEAALTPEQAATMRELDKGWAGAKVYEDALGRVPLGEELMPSHLAASVKAPLSRAELARGYGGVMRDLAATGREAFNYGNRVNGSLGVIESLPGSRYLTSPIAAAINTDPVRNLLMSRRTQALIDALRAPAEEAAGNVARRALLIPATEMNQ